MANTSDRPLDQRLAGWIVRPLVPTRVHPNHLTTLTLALGALAGGLFAFAGPAWTDAAAGCFMLAVFSDHLDGELARASGKTSRFGHYYDYVAGGLIYTLLFCGLGLGLREGPLGQFALALGLAAGLSNPVVMTLRILMEERFGAASVDHPYRFGFTIEDFIYLIGPITWLGGVEWFFVPYALGTLGYLAWTVLEFWRHARARATVRAASTPS